MLTTESLPPLEPHQQRAVNEAIDLGSKVAALQRFLTTPTFGSLSAAEQTLLVAQLGAMLTYEATLNARIETWCREAKRANPGPLTGPTEAQSADGLRPT